MVQEYGRYFGMPTVCFRGGCLTGPNHSGAELHGFLAYLARGVARGPRRTGSTATRASRSATTSTPTTSARRSWPSTSARAPRAVYNLGGGRANSVSMLEAIARFEELIGAQARRRVRRPEPRAATTSATSATLRASGPTTPTGSVSISLDDIFDQLVGIVGAGGAGLR